MPEIKDFDALALKRHEESIAHFGEHPFKFRDEIFYVRANVSYEVMKSISSITEESEGSKVIATVEHAVINLIDPRDNALERFHTVCLNVEFPVTFEDLMELLNWLMEEQTSRPPTRPESSSGGLSTNGTQSKELSSTEQAAVSTS